MQRKQWFRAKKYGYGWYPITWQGWAVVALYAYAVTTQAVALDAQAHSVSDVLFKFLPHFYILTVFMIIIGSAMGEPARWRWGEASQKKIEVLDPEGNPTEHVADISEVHSDALWHRTANVYIVNSKNEVLFQKRSMNHVTLPGLWQVGVGGHVIAGQTSLEAAQQEVEEEIGISLPENEIIFMGTSRVKEVFDETNFNNEYQDNYIVYKDLDVGALALQEGEVAGVKWLPLEEMKKVMAARDPAYVYHTSTPIFFSYIERHGTHKNS